MATIHDLDTVLDAIRGTGQWMGFDDKSKAPISRPSGGIVRTIAARLGVSRQTIYSYCKRWATVKEAIDDEREGLIDMAEGKLFEEVTKGNITAIIFTLKTLGKSRGYVERWEHTGEGGGSIRVRWDEPGDND